MVLNDLTPQHTHKPLYIVKRTPENTLLTITSFIHSQNSNEIMCPETNKSLISICGWIRHGCFKRTKNIDINSFNKFRDDYSSYMLTTYNKEHEFVKISSNSPNYFELSINTELIKTPKGYVNYLKVLSNVPVLTLVEGVCSTYPIDSSPRYTFSISPNKPNPFWFGFAGIFQYPYIHIIQEGSTYFLKYEFLSKLTDHKTKVDELKMLYETDTTKLNELKRFGKTNLQDAIKAETYELLEAELSATFFPNVDARRLSTEITGDNMFSIYFIINLDYLDDDFNFLEDIPFGL